MAVLNGYHDDTDVCVANTEGTVRAINVNNRVSVNDERKRPSVGYCVSPCQERRRIHINFLRIIG